MAGPLAIVPDNEHQLLVVSKPFPSADKIHSWQVHFSRFIPFPPSPPATCPSLNPLPNNRRFRPTPGTWISSRSPSASLQLLFNDFSLSLSVLSVLFQGNLLEEHYVSRLQFSWPQVTCVSGFPARGTRAVIVSYKDSVGERQKFALRFSAASEAETFMSSLKNILKDPTEGEPLSSDFRSAISLHSEFMSTTNRTPSRAGVDELSDYSPQVPLGLDYDLEQASCTKNTNLGNDYNVISPEMPPSFLSLLTNCCSEVKKAETWPMLSEEDLKSFAARYLDDSSFLDMLLKVEKIINEMGDDLLL